MTALPEVVSQSELLNQLVLNRSTLEELGRIEVLWMYPSAHRVLGFVCKSGFLGTKKLAFKLSQVEAIGVNGILTHSQPDPTDTDHVRQLESLIHCEVWSNAGNKLGKVIDYLFNLRNGVISDYLVVGDRLSILAGTIYRLPPTKIISIGHRRILVAETSLQSFAPYREGIPQKLSKVGNELKAEYTQVKDELRAIAQRAQATTQHTATQLKTLAEQAREQAQFLAEQARETSEIWLEELQERAETLGEDLKDSTQTLTVQAQEILDSVVEESLERSPAKTDMPATSTAPPQQPVASTVSPPEPNQASVKTSNTTAQPSPAPSHTNEELWDLEDDFWESEPETEQPASDRIAVEAVDDDPWDVTTPPVSRPASDSSPAPARPTAPPPSAAQASPQASSPSPIDEDDEPWI